MLLFDTIKNKLRLYIIDFITFANHIRQWHNQPNRYRREEEKTKRCAEKKIDDTVPNTKFTNTAKRKMPIKLMNSTCLI